MPRAVLIDPKNRVLRYLIFYGDERRDAHTIWNSLQVRNYIVRPLMNYQISANGVVFTIEPNSHFRREQMVGVFRLNGHLVHGPAIIAGASDRNTLVDSPTLEQIKRFVTAGDDNGANANRASG